MAGKFGSAGVARANMKGGQTAKGARLGLGAKKAIARTRAGTTKQGKGTLTGSGGG